MAASLRTLFRAGVLAFLLGSAASWALLVERVTRGEPSPALSACFVLFAFALLASFEARATRREGSSLALVFTQIGASVAAIVVAHAVIAIAHPNGLVESPRQLVNDVVLIASVSAFAWSHAARTAVGRVALVAPAAALLVGYGATAARWHCDVVAFARPVQQLVVTQALLVALALFVFDLLSFERS